MFVFQLAKTWHFQRRQLTSNLLFTVHNNTGEGVMSEVEKAYICVSCSHVHSLRSFWMFELHCVKQCKWEFDARRLFPHSSAERVHFLWTHWKYYSSNSNTLEVNLCPIFSRNFNTLRKDLTSNFQRLKLVKLNYTCIFTYSGISVREKE